MSESGSKTCPACGEQIALAARKCRHCGEYFIQCPRCAGETAKGFEACHLCGTALPPASMDPPPRPVEVDRWKGLVGSEGQAQAAYVPQSPDPLAGQVARQVALTRSFVGPAVLAWILYYVGFYIVGLIVNLCYLASAARIKRETGVSPSGKGCLSFLLFVHFWLPLIIFIFLVAFGTHMGFNVFGWLETMLERMR